MSGATHQLRLRSVIEETAEARSFELEVPAELAEIYHYQSGQFLGFEVTVSDQPKLDDADQPILRQSRFKLGHLSCRTGSDAGGASRSAVSPAPPRSPRRIDQRA